MRNGNTSGSGGGIFCFEPSFVHFDPNSNSNTWDFHLQSAYGWWDPNSEIWVTDSNRRLCIDAGDSNSDMNGNASDFDVDGKVNFEDFCELAGKWLRQGNFVEDLFNDGTVNFVDLHIFVEDWL